MIREMEEAPGGGRGWRERGCVQSLVLREIWVSSFIGVCHVSGSVAGGGPRVGRAPTCLVGRSPDASERKREERERSSRFSRNASRFLTPPFLRPSSRTRTPSRPSQHARRPGRRLGGRAGAPLAAGAPAGMKMKEEEKHGERATLKQRLAHSQLPPQATSTPAIITPAAQAGPETGRPGRREVLEAERERK